MQPPTLSDLEDWRKSHPWPNDRQVEQDLYLSRMLVAIYGDDDLAENLHFKGGTALHKLHLPMPFRYSEDIDINRASGGRAGPLLTKLREVLEPWMGRARYGQNRLGMFRFVFRVPLMRLGRAASHQAGVTFT